MSDVIRAICDNGYDGILIPGFSLLIRYNGKEVIHTYSPKPKTHDELMECLKTMPQFMDMLREQENDLKQVTRVNVEDILKDTEEEKEHE